MGKRGPGAIVEKDRILGPYLDKRDGRKYVHVFKNGKRFRTLYYSRYIMEQHVGRQLHPKEETVDHINRDKTDDRIENLRIVPISRHVSEDRLRVNRVKCSCVWCDKGIIRESSWLKKGFINKHAGPFCGNKCKFEYMHYLNRGGKKLTPQTDIEVKKAYIKKVVSE